MGAEILSFNDTPFDDIEFRVVPFLYGDAKMYTLVEEKVLDGRVVADRRRQLTATQFKSLSDAVNSVEDNRDAETELNCAEEILDALAADLNLQKTDFECIGDYITAVVGKMKDDAAMWQAIRRNWKTYKASYIHEYEDAPNVMKSATITLGFYEGHPEKKADFIERDLRESIEYFENVPRVNGVVVTHWMDDRGYVITDNWLRYSKNSTSDDREAYNIPCVKVKGKVVRLK